MSGEKKFMIGIGVFSVLILVVIIISASKQNEKLSVPLAGEEQDYLGASHVPRGSVTQAEDPPTSGDHYGDGVGGPGIHDEPVEDGLIVHSMEHGAVVLHYDPEVLEDEKIDQLKELFTSKLKGKKIMIPRSGMSKPIIMTSWGQTLKLDEIDEEQLVNFMETNNDRGPERVSTY